MEGRGMGNRDGDGVMWMEIGMGNRDGDWDGVENGDCVGNGDRDGDGDIGEMGMEI